MRLQKYMAYCGVASRRKSEELIISGGVKVNGITVTDLGIKIDPQRDKVNVLGRNVSLDDKMVYIILNKPKGTVTTVNDQFGRPTVMNYIKNIKSRVYPVGRLDYDSEGLLILTNDGDFTYKMTHPSHEIEKEYYVEVQGKLTKKDIIRIESGINIGDYITLPSKLYIGKVKGNNSTYNIVIKEGKNRQVRRMFDAVGHKVLVLKRLRIGNILLSNLQPGEWRYMTSHELNGIIKLVKGF